VIRENREEIENWSAVAAPRNRDGQRESTRNLVGVMENHELLVGVMAKWQSKVP
jgi:hypothetical protein